MNSIEWYCRFIDQFLDLMEERRATEIALDLLEAVGDI